MTDDWNRLGQEVRARRQELGYTQSDVQAHGGPSTALLRGIENATSKTLSRSKRRDLERALRWPNEHVDAILEGRPVQDVLVDFGPPEPRRLRAVPSAGEDTRPDRSVLLDALSALEAAREALNHGRQVDVATYVNHARELVLDLVQRSFWGVDVSARPTTVPERAVANEDDTLEQVSEAQQDEP